MANREQVSPKQGRRSQRKSTRQHADENEELQAKKADNCCELCQYEKKTRVTAYAFCQQCSIFLCKYCIDLHKQTPVLTGHILLQGARMPKCQADRTVKYSNCHLHRETANDCYCFDHFTMICHQCETRFHQSCTTQFVPILCTSLSQADVNRFKVAVKNIEHNVASVKDILNDNAVDVEEQRKIMVKQAEDVRDEMIEKINKAFKETLENINSTCNGKCSEITKKLSVLSDMLSSFENVNTEVEKAENDYIGPNQFIKFQAYVKDMAMCSKKLNKQFKRSELSFCPTPQDSMLNDWCKRVGRVKETMSDIAEAMDSPVISFPDSSDPETTTSRKRKHRDISIIRPARMISLNARLAEDEETCGITGMAVTTNGSLIVLDSKNEKVKILSADNKVLSKISIPAKLNTVTVADDKRAMVYATNTKGKPVFQDVYLHILDISNEESVSLKKSIPCSFLHGIVAYRNYLIISSDVYPSGVKMVDFSDQELGDLRTAQIIWSVQAAYNNMLFRHPGTIVKQFDNGRSTIVVVDWGKNTITTLAAENGSLVNSATVNENIGYNVASLTADEDGNIYTLVRMTNEIRVWTPDLQESRSLTPDRINMSNATSIVYNDLTQELLIGYEEWDFIDRLQLS